MAIHVMSVSGSNRFSPVNLQSVLNDITHYGLLLEGYASIVVQGFALNARHAELNLIKSAWKLFQENQKQVVFYKKQLSPQIAYMLTESKKAAREQIINSAQIINCQQPDSEARKEARKMVAGLVEGINTTFTKRYVSSRLLYEKIELLSRQAAESYQALSGKLDEYMQSLENGQMHAMAVMTALDLQEETLRQHLDDWVVQSLSAPESRGLIIVQRSVDRHNLYYDYLSLSECSEHAMVIDRNNQQKLALNKELDNVDPLLASLKQAVLLLQSYSQCMSKLSLATRRLVTNWGEISNNLAIQSHELSSQWDCNQLFKVITTDVPSAKKSGHFLAKRIGMYEQRLANKNPYSPVVHPEGDTAGRESTCSNL